MKKNSTIMLPQINEALSTEESGARIPVNQEMKETTENSKKDISVQKRESLKELNNQKLVTQVSNIANKNSALTMFLQESRFFQNTGHIIDMGSQVLYIGIIGKEKNDIKAKIL